MIHRGTDIRVYDGVVDSLEISTPMALYCGGRLAFVSLDEIAGEDHKSAPGALDDHHSVRFLAFLGKFDPVQERLV